MALIGLSPYTRGNPLPAIGQRDGPWSIPVHTGKPLHGRRPSHYQGVYPRTHGETYTAGKPQAFPRGLSPYTRGNRYNRMQGTCFTRSIPVHTGKPNVRIRRRQQERVYPRTHGETEYFRDPTASEKGLSPYTRGNPSWSASSRPHEGSIPVHTGKPTPSVGTFPVSTVYPRTHGETPDVCFCLGKVLGLSPYTRGNLRHRPPSRWSLWSIPVHTGKPYPVCDSPSSYWVYPRTHGETLTISSLDSHEWGLSPYTRGNLRLLPFLCLRVRSIPVHTGKPLLVVSIFTLFTVYPRTHGETYAEGNTRGLHDGLSPYTRGNHFRNRCRRTGRRSIPVHTGKPHCINKFGRRSTVYPRTHGETGYMCNIFQIKKGLSPYTRGNPSCQRDRQHRAGSIPVHTGKPLT